MNLYNTIKRILGGLGVFLFVWTLYLTLRRRSFNIRLKITRFLTYIIYHWIWGDGRERIKKNISLIRPDLTESEIAQGAWRTAKTIARSWAAMLGNEFTTLEEIKKKLEVEGIEKLLEYYHNGRKIIVTAVHIGPIDEMFGIIPLFNLRVYIPVEPVNPKWYFNLMMRLRLRFEGIILEPVEKGKTLLQAAKHLSDGRIVVLLVDIPKQDERGVMCRIGNAKVRFAVGAVKLALEEDSAIFPVFPSWQGDGRIKIVVGQPFKLIQTGNIIHDIETNTRRLIEEIFAPHIQENYDSWLRLLWADLKPVEADETQGVF